MIKPASAMARLSSPQAIQGLPSVIIGDRGVFVDRRIIKRR